MARFEDQDLTDAEFRECDLTRARLIGVVMQDAVIDGLVTNLVVNGVEVTSYVEAELDRRHPVRVLIRSRTRPICGRHRVSCMPAGPPRSSESAVRPASSAARERRVVGGADDAPPGLRPRLVVPPLLPGICGAVHARLASDFVPYQEEHGLDRAAAPALDEMLTVRDEQAAELERWLAR